MHHLRCLEYVNRRTLFAAFLVALLLVALATGASAQVASEVSPRFAVGKPLTVALSNFSKLPMKLTALTVEFATAPGAPPCKYTVAGPIAVTPSKITTVSVAANRELLQCLARSSPRSPVRPRRASVRETRGGASAAVVPPATGSAVLHTAAVSYRVEVGKHASADRATWHFTLE